MLKLSGKDILAQIHKDLSEFRIFLQNLNGGDLIQRILNFDIISSMKLNLSQNSSIVC